MTQHRRKRTPDESWDVVATFFENMATAVREGGGLFHGEDFHSGEKRLIGSGLRSQARYYREKADSYRSERARGEDKEKETE